MIKGSYWLLMLTAACTAQPALAPVPAGGVDPSAAARFAARTVRPGSQRASFAWRLDEAGERFNGRGVARFEAPDRIRLDLFGPRGETYLAAALVGDSIRVPPGAGSQVVLPSPTLLWASLGVADLPSGGNPVALSGAGADSTLRVSGAGEDSWEFRTRGGVLSGVRRAAGRNVAESVELARTANGGLASARYRNWAAYRTLDLNFDSIGNAEAFPETIWLGAAAGR